MLHCGGTTGSSCGLSTGIGYASTEIEIDAVRFEYNGGIADGNIAIGGMVTSNLALHGTLLGWIIDAPDFESLGSQGPTSGEVNGDVTMSAIGIGRTYYFMPTNIYLSGNLGLGKLDFDVEGTNIDPDRGLILEGTVGKAWWGSSNWGLGPSLVAPPRCPVPSPPPRPAPQSLSRA